VGLMGSSDDALSGNVKISYWKCGLVEKIRIKKSTKIIAVIKLISKAIFKSLGIFIDESGNFFLKVNSYGYTKIKVFRLCN
jgi:hypothetical protein